MLSSVSGASSFKKARAFPDWLRYGLVTLLALLAIAIAFVLRDYADSRADVLEHLADMQTLATEQSRLMWQALGEQDRMTEIALRGKLGTTQETMGLIFENLYRLEEYTRRLDTWFDTEAMIEISELEAYMLEFQSNVISTFNFLPIMPAQDLRSRFRFGDPKFDALDEQIGLASRAASQAATRANQYSSLAILCAIFLTLMAALWASLRLGRMRVQRDLDITKEREVTLKRSEARFKALVQNSSDVIALLAEDQTLRYLSPAAKQVLAISPEDWGQKPFWSLFSLDKTPAAKDLHFERGELKRDLELQVSDLLEHPDVEGIVVNIRDVTEQRAFEAQLRYQALHDPLTDLPNRRNLKEQLETQLQADTQVAVLFIDLDGFKLVNDSYGHSAGDSLLKAVARRIRTFLKPGDLLARLGGDEFIALLPSQGAQEALATAQAILKTLEPPFALEATEIFVTASIGVAAERQKDADTFIQQADIAMYYAKQNGKARAALFQENMASLAADRLELQTDFRRGLERSEFKVYYQPKVGLASGKTESLEALVRWEHPHKGLISPVIFIPFAEETGLIEPLGKIILETACQDAAAWQDYGVVVAVNLSPAQFRNPKLVDEVRIALEKSGLNPALLELEITESAILGDINATIDLLKQLKGLGVRLAIDDFGTGYSNISHLKHFDVDVLKIDQSFIRGSGKGPEGLSDEAIVEAMVALGKAFGLHVVAEGVETSVHVDQLRLLNCDLGQGYYFSKPVERRLITERLRLEAEQKGLPRQFQRGQEQV